MEEKVSLEVSGGNSLNITVTAKTEESKNYNNLNNFDLEGQTDLKLQKFKKK